MKIYNNTHIPEGLGNNQPTYEEMYQAGYESGYTDGYADGYDECHHDYSKDYFTIEVIKTNQDGIIQVRNVWDCEYRKNGGEWEKPVKVDGYSSYIYSVLDGDNIELKCTNPKLSWAFSQQILPDEYRISGNIMSMFYGDDFVGKKGFSEDNSQLLTAFYLCTGLTDASNLILPVTSLTPYCYQSMFEGCTSLTAAPELPATTLAERCYSYMFHGCTSLVNAPELPATTLAVNCYADMFSDCTSLETTPELSVEILADYCYVSMFSGCTGLTNAPVNIPSTLTLNCCGSMFRGCTSLVTAPDLPAEELTEYCYYEMFSGCTNLTYIKCLVTNTSGTGVWLGPTGNWLAGVSSTGTFVKSPNAWPGWERGASGIPEGWTVVDYVPE